MEGLGGTYGEQKITYGKRDFNKPFQIKLSTLKGDKSWKAEWDEFKNLINKKKVIDDSGYKALKSLRKHMSLLKKIKY